MPFGGLREVSWLLVSKEIKISLILLELLPDNVELVSQLVILFGNLEEVVAADGLNHTNRPCLEFLQKLGVIAHETVGAEAGALHQKIIIINKKHN